MKKHRVIFQPSGRRGEIEEGKTILEAAQALGVDIEGLCGSKSVCGKCKVRIEEGYFEKDNIESGMAHLSAISDDETKHIKEDDGPGIRLACKAEVQGDIKIFVPERSRAGKQIVRKAAKKLDIAIEPVVRKFNIEMAPPTLHDLSRGDAERLLKAMKEQHGLDGLSIDFEVLRQVQDAFREGKWKATVTVWHDSEIIRIEPGHNEALYGLAVDVGTTTVVGYLCDLNTGEAIQTESIMNPQVPYGEDVMSRITYAMSNPDGLKTMQRAIAEGLNEIVSRYMFPAHEGGNGEEPSAMVPGGDNIVDMTLVFNTAMHHIMLGLNPEYIGRSPFIPAAQHSLNIKARDIGIKINPSAYIHVLPIEAGFVGSDNCGVLIAEAPYEQDEKVLIIDIGTNGELLLGNREAVCSTSCATGPAFEGAQIKYGMRAAPGAIEKIKIDPATKECTYEIIEDANPKRKTKTKGVCGSGIIDAVAELFTAEIIDKSGRFKSDIENPRVRKDPSGKFEYVIAWADETSVGADITITQADVRALQLAKGALYAGTKLMMQRMGIETLDRVVLAGAFGSYINREAAMTLGMFPDCDPAKVIAVGNAAGDGARMALLNKNKRTEADERARWVNFVEIAVEKEFEKEFMMAMHIPHMKDKFPNLKALLESKGATVSIKG